MSSRDVADLVYATFAAYEGDIALGLLTDLENELAVLDNAIEGNVEVKRQLDAMRRRIAFVLFWLERDRITRGKDVGDAA